MAGIKKIVLVGHCGPDSSMLRYAVKRAAGHAAIHSADDADSVSTLATPDSLLLINRVLGGDFADDSGIALIQKLAKLPNPPMMMLISDYPDAQAQAVAAGASPGFGKSQAGTSATAQLLQSVVDADKG